MKILLAILLVLAVLLAACNGTSPAAPSGSELRIITEEYPPFNFVDKNNNVTGQSTEIVRAILAKTGKKAAIEVMPLSEGLTLAQKGPGVVIYSINRTGQREQLFKWVGPIGSYTQAFYAKNGSTITINKLEDARNVNKIGVYKGDAGSQFLASQGFTNLDESLTDTGALQKLMNGAVQLWLGNKEGLAVSCAQAGVNPGDLVMMPVMVTMADLYIAISKDIPDSTIISWQSALGTLKQEKDTNGKTVYEQIQAKYSDSGYIESILPK